MGDAFQSHALLVVISAPSGAGKTTLCQQLTTADPGIGRAITCTTRTPRPGERDGVDYYFLAADTFQKRVQAGEFLEHATVHGNQYGTLRSEVLNRLRAGGDVLLNVDVQGAASIREQARQNMELRRAMVQVFLSTASLTELELRLRKRNQDSEEVIRKRLAAARREIAEWRHFDYLLISTTIPDDLRRMQVILESERMRTSRVAPPQP
jgi:guanylate kinase